LVTPKERAKHELLFNERAFGQKKVKALTLQTVKIFKISGKVSGRVGTTGLYTVSNLFCLFTGDKESFMIALTPRRLLFQEDHGGTEGVVLDDGFD
jgi:hypothetical protein